VGLVPIWSQWGAARVDRRASQSYGRAAIAKRQATDPDCVERLHRGDRIGVTGRIEQDKYRTPEGWPVDHSVLTDQLDLPPEATQEHPRGEQHLSDSPSRQGSVQGASVCRRLRGPPPAGSRRHLAPDARRPTAVIGEAARSIP